MLDDPAGELGAELDVMIARAAAMDRAVARVTGWIAASCSRVRWTEPDTIQRKEIETHVLGLACATEATLLAFTEEAVEEAVRTEEARVLALRMAGNHL
jgi:hypothetical protein